MVDGRRDGKEMTVQELYDFFEVCLCNGLTWPCVCMRVHHLSLGICTNA